MARIAAILPDLFFASKVTETLAAAGHEVSVVAPGDAVDADLLIVDLDATTDEPALPTDVPRLGFYSHVDVRRVALLIQRRVRPMRRPVRGCVAVELEAQEIDACVTQFGRQRNHRVPIDRLEYLE